LLEERLATGVLQVQAPAGCGKTAVILQFLHDQGLEPRWHICEVEDAEPANLLSSLVRAIGAADSVAGRTAIAALTSLRAGQSYRVALRPFLDELEHAGSSTSVLVIDDADVLIGSPAALEAVDFLISQCSSFMQIVLISRADLPLGSQAKRLLEGRAARVMAEDLLFRAEEIAAFARSAFNVELSEEETSLLYRATGGWAIALGLALRLRDLGMAVQTDDHAQFTPQARADLFAYLTAEVLSRVDERIARFLRQTAILDTLDPAACARLTGEERPLEMIQSLARAGLPVLKAGWGAYRCHSLLREYLIDALSQAEQREAHINAGQIFAELGDWAGALNHFTAGRDTQAALAIADKHGRELFYQGHGRTLLELVKEAPDDDVDLHDGARYWAAFAAARMFQLDWAESAFERVHANAVARGDTSTAQESLRALAQTLNNWGRYPAATAVAQRLLTTVPVDDVAGRASVTIGYLITSMGATGQFREAVADVRRLVPLLMTPPRPDAIAEAYARSVAAVTFAFEGDFSAARAEISLARVLVQGQQDDDIHSYVPWSAALVEFMAGEPARAGEAAREAEAIALRYGDLQRVLECRAVLACAATMRGDVDAADRGFAQLDALRGGGTDFWGVILTLLSRPERMRLHGDVAGALAAAEANLALSVSTGSARFVCSTRLDVSSFRLMSGDVDGAREHARQALAEANALEAALLVYGASLMMAASSATDEAAAMADALRIADERDYRFLMPYAVRLPQLDAALWRALGSDRAARAAILLAGTNRACVAALRPIANALDEPAALAAIAVLQQFGADGRAALHDLASSGRRRVAAAARASLAALEAANPHGLSGRELEVLQLLREGMRTKDIAQQLVLTPATVSTHIQRIMSKTGTASRAELLALAARESGQN
jgi:ATP/maltotriose-dependent transcriptional regulator MalT